MQLALPATTLALSIPAAECEPSSARELRGLGRLRRLRGGRDKSPLVEYSAGPPTASLMPPGRCVFDEEWRAAPLLRREWIGHDTLLLTFGLQDAQSPLGLSTCACLLARGAAPSGGGEAVVRPRTRARVEPIAALNL